MMEFQPSRQIATVLQWVLNIALLILGVLLIVFMGKETLTLINLLFSGQEKTTYLLLDSIVTYFLYFEFIALIVKYFSSGYHFPLRYFIYIGITAMVRLIIVDHSDANATFLHTLSILALTVALYLANTDKLKRS
ncbi:TPA: phosphate-starvation-inducible protein PsiE [Morganella morganii subsp. sibonii]|uniref:Protein PsiE n=2 Tax=Morganellaceae TaxID=1903414 RepID=A0A8F5TZC2_MORMO|nr:MULTISPECIES: phosphate-starvation-inducible protein PsiE [Morganella]HDS6842747.1 phosphate-starvation-inducible protein PsiE [Morganella morganii subsp. morganii]HDU8310275.1 phosphate-starvation-inducible protein PsiE [Morganella morganii subsp. sibonii]EJD6037705.1 phosphate-starvation-inducible protein PsiE [Morganella morganii]EKK5569691.1 phosphate-starvation-inducible protein PsiE [Morganella morganii]EKU5841162.1 phosphate-starvation-inducible protein PsiE [Morganella morganii]